MFLLDHLLYRLLQPIRHSSSKVFPQIVVCSYCQQRVDNTRKAVCQNQYRKTRISLNIYKNFNPKPRIYRHCKVENQMGNICKRVRSDVGGTENEPRTKEQRNDEDLTNISPPPDENSRSEISGLCDKFTRQRSPQDADESLSACGGRKEAGDGRLSVENDEIIVVSDSDSLDVKLLTTDNTGSPDDVKIVTTTDKSDGDLIIDDSVQLTTTESSNNQNNNDNDCYIVEEGQPTSEGQPSDENSDMAYGGHRYPGGAMRHQFYNHPSSGYYHPQHHQPQQGPAFHQRQSRWDQEPVSNTLTFHREWENTEFGKKYWKNRPTGFTFSLMSYNTLAQSLVTPNMYLYPHCDYNVLQWQHRMTLFQHQFNFYSPDILCLQEIDEDSYSNFYNPFLLTLGYQGLYKKRCGNKKDGCATFFKTAKFSLICWNLVEYYRPDINVLDKDNVAILCLLKPLSGNSTSPICVANTHLLFNPRRGDIKLAQVSMMLAEADKMASNFQHGGSGGRRKQHSPLIMCGDFNSVPNSPLHYFMLNKRLCYSNLYGYEISGQEDHGARNMVPSPLWPGKIGVTDQCQLLDTQPFREDVNRKLANGGGNMQSLLRQYYTTYRPSQRYFKNAPEPSDTLTHQFDLRSVYNHPDVHTQEHDITSHHRKACCVLDYIFYSSDTETNKGSREGNLKLLSRVKLLSGRQIENCGGLPNQRWPSDHLFLMGKFTLLPER